MKLEAIASQPSADLNEDTTRLRLIDTLLFDCLGYPRAAVTTEEYLHPGYADYIIRAPNPHFVLEAKREGSTFELPAGLAGRPTVSLRSLMEDPVARDAIEQVLKYARGSGIPIAGISNGRQLAVFLGSRSDGKLAEDGDAVVFVSFDDMLDRFLQMWDLISFSATGQRSLLQVLMMGSPAPAPPQKMSATIRNYPGYRRRSERETDLKILSAVFIQDIEGAAEVSDEFLRDCFIETGALAQYAFVSKEILRSRYSGLPDVLGVETQPVRSNKGLNPSLSQDLTSTAISLKPLVLLGDVGVGKTMFVRHLIRIEAADELAQSLVFYVDFGQQPALQSDLRGHVVRSITEQLDSSYGIDTREDGFVRATYNKEINAFAKGIYGRLKGSDPDRYSLLEIEELGRRIADEGDHLERSLKHLSGSHRRRSVIVFDNVDQRSSDFQDDVFLLAQALTSSLGSTLFVSLRPTTFYDSKLRGSLAAYQPRVFLVAPTRIDHVVAKRLAFARKVLLDRSPSDSPLSMSADDLLAYLNVLEKGFTKNESLIALLENLSGGNTRLALEYLSTFIGSGYVDTNRILDVAKRGDVYTIPIHEFLRSILYGENDLFDPNSSRIVNVFDISTGDSLEHFLLPLLLAETKRRGSNASGDGYVDASILYERAQVWGFSALQVQWHLDRATSKGLIEAQPGATESGPFRITTVGAYMTDEMVTEFSYVDAVVVDTPVLDPTVRSALTDVRPIADRLERARVFRSYLDECWDQFGSKDSMPFEWPVQSARLGTNIEVATERAERAQERY